MCMWVRVCVRACMCVCMHAHVRVKGVVVIRQIDIAHLKERLKGVGCHSEIQALQEIPN